MDLNRLREQRCGRDLGGGIRFKQHRHGSPCTGERGGEESNPWETLNVGDDQDLQCVGIYINGLSDRSDDGELRARHELRE
jgi:hypothetical protein